MSDFLLPEHLLGEILKRLPAENLVQCTRVCKQWHSLITSRHFISAHLSYSLSTPTPPPSSRILLRSFNPRGTERFSFLSSSDTPRAKTLTATIPFPFRAEHDLHLRIVGCVHGLLCLSDDVFSYSGVTILWNPLIRRYLRLPPPRLTYDSLRRHYTCFLGFGYDSKNRDYKVVRLVYLLGHTSPPMPDVLPPRAEAYSEKDGFWREISDVAAGVEYSICEDKWSQCFVDGRMHWAAYEATPEIQNMILVFDVSKEKFKKMTLPECLLIVCPMLLFVSEIWGCLGLLEYFPCQDRTNGCNVWIRKDYDSDKSWTRLYRIVVDGGFSYLLNVGENGEVLVVNRNDKLASYKPESEELNVLGFRGRPEAFYCQPYVESLLLLDEDSCAASYGGAKTIQNKKKTKKMEKKKHQKKGSTHSKQQDEADSPFLLVPEETFSNEREWIRPARVDWNTRMAVKLFVQSGMAKGLTFV